MSGRRSALVLYGSETGNAQDVAEEVGAVAERLHFTTQVSELNHVKPETLESYTIVFLAVSTTGQGDLPANARTFWRSLLLKKLPPTFLSGVRFTWFGLGDSSYPKFNWAARKLHKRLLQLGAKEIYPGGEADHQHPEGCEPIPDDVQLPPKWVLHLRDQDSVPSPDVSATPAGAEPISQDFPDSYRLDHDYRPLHDSLTATLVQNKRVTPQTHWQDVRQLTLTVPDTVSYAPGDVIAITPKNNAEDVQSLIEMMGWQEQADQLISLVPRDNTRPTDELPTPPIHNLHLHAKLTIRELLINYLDIRAIPRRSFFSAIAHYTTYEMHKERLLEFTNPEFLDEFWDYTTRPRRSILEILHEFDTVKIPWQHATSAFPIFRGRQFSIASGGELKRTASGSARFELLIAIVKYRTVIKRVREGVCTKYIANLRPGSTLRVQLQRGGLNSSVGQLVGPTMLIGPGTGVAPLRSMLWEKAAIVKSYTDENPGVDPPIEPTILLYGGRNRASDFFFEDEWHALSDLIKLKVLTAFSRDQTQKVYVQDVIKENASLVFNLLHDKGGAVFVCGSSGRMPQAVREALTEAFQSGNEAGTQGFTRREAEDYLVGMEKSGRYKQETCGLRILVPVKRVIDYAIKPRINKAQTGVETTGVKHSLNPFDELSVEEAVRLRERKGPLKVENILALSAGGPKTPDTLRTAMAMGADRAFHIDVPDSSDGGLEPLTVAKTLKAVVEKENINLVLLGKQAIDGDQGQTGQMLAGLLGWPQATQASNVEIKDEQGTVEVTHEVDGGVETLRAKLPMVVTTDLRLNEPRYASLPNIMKAKKKPLEKMTLADLGVEDKRRLKTLKVTEPPARQGGGKVEDVDGLVAKLKELGAL
ncbi:NAPDH-dependent diflavin reductase [Aspergillus undulatus]|uniref:NAPDH-dependent diflavin reductase n=1 Tax=Aspergillus undulatus TaxID=1810928 RepID=UPI003CCE1DBE